MVVGHDAGAPVAAWAALIRPDVFRSVTIMSSPFEGPPAIPFDTANGAAPPPRAATDDELDAELAKLQPPRKYYQNYQRTRGANDNMLHAPQGLHAFFRAYYHYKSADWKGNHPHPLKARTAAEMAQIPTYYVMERDKGMAETVAPFVPSAAEIAACKWLTEAEVDVYATEYARTQFTGALQGYRVRRGSDRRASPSCGRSRAARSTCLRCSSAAAATGRLSDAGRRGQNAEDRVHADDRLPSRRGSGPLGAAGAARTGEQAARTVSPRPTLRKSRNERDLDDSERQGSQGAGRTAAAAGPLPPRTAAPDGHARRLRHEPVRRVHDPCRRRSAKSCTLFAVQADGSAITTIEGLARNGELHPMQVGFWEEHGLQCGFCTPGMIMTAVNLLADNARPTEREIREGIAGNFCRCTGYQHIVNAIQHAANRIGSAAPGREK